MKLEKKEKDEEFWARLTTDKVKEKSFVTIDWDRYVDEDEQDGDFDDSNLAGGQQMGMPGMGGMPSGMGGAGPSQRSQQQSRGPPSDNSSPRRPDMNGPDGIDSLIKTMNLEPNKIPDLDNISLVSGDTDRKSGITLNL